MLQVLASPSFLSRVSQQRPFRRGYFPLIIAWLLLPFALEASPWGRLMRGGSEVLKTLRPRLCAPRLCTPVAPSRAPLKESCLRQVSLPKTLRAAHVKVPLMARSTPFSQALPSFGITRRRLHTPRPAWDLGQYPEIQIINPCTDWGFKHGFEGHPEVYTELINALLGLEGERAFTNVIFLNPVLASLHPKGTGFCVDILARAGEDDNARYCVVEMQNDFRPAYLDRVRAAHGRFESNLDKIEAQHRAHDHDESAVNKSMTKGFYENDLSGVYSIVISNQDSREPQPQAVNTYEWRHRDYPERVMGTVESTITFVTLAQFEKRPEELETPLDRFLFLLKDPRLKQKKVGISLYKDVPATPLVMGEEESALYQLYQRLRSEHISPEERAIIETVDERFHITEEQRALYYSDGRADGRAEGHAAGHEDGYEAGLKVMMNYIVTNIQNQQGTPAQAAKLSPFSEEEIKAALARAKKK